MKYISYETADSDTKNVNVSNMTEEQIINEIAFLQSVGETGAESPLHNITLNRDGEDYSG